MITLLIAVLLGGALLWASLGTRHSVRVGILYSKATALARSYVERIKAMDYDDIADAADVGVLIDDNATAALTDDVNGAVTTEVTDNGNDTKTVLVTVSWTSKALGSTVNHQVDISALVSDF